MGDLNQKALSQRLDDNNVRARLEEIEKDERYNTRASSYSANAALYPDHQIPFVERHIAYLMNHPKLDCNQYLANLRLMLKVR